MQKAVFLVVMIISLCFTNKIYSQAREYMYFGVEAKAYTDLGPLSNVVDDFNNYHKVNDFVTSHKLALPLYFQGYMIGAKVNSRFSEFGGNVHFANYSTFAQGEISGGTEYYKKISFSHTGFHFHWRGLLINTNYFRAGPGLGFKIEQYRIKLDYDKNQATLPVFPVNNALFSGQVNYNISIGGPKLNFDIGIFYQIPFSKIDLSQFNTDLNGDFATTYTETELNFKQPSWGVYLCIGLGSKRNYDF